jgi:hypothetical protein
MQTFSPVSTVVEVYTGQAKLRPVTYRNGFPAITLRPVNKPALATLLKDFPQPYD